jgi:hypothetical protein
MTQHVTDLTPPPPGEFNIWSTSLELIAPAEGWPVAVPLTVELLDADGISVEGDILDLAITAKLVDKTGTWLRYGETHLGQGREKARLFLKENPAVAKELREKILASKEAVIAVEGIVGGDGEASAETSGEADE